MVVDSIDLTATVVNVNGSPMQTLASGDARYAQLAAANTLSRVNTFTTSPVISALTPQLNIRETDAATDEKNWIVRAAGGDSRISTASDAAPSSVVATALRISRTGTVVASIDLTATVVNVNGSPVQTTSTADARYAQLAAANNFTQQQTITQGGGAFTLKAGATSDHVYMEFYADSAAQTTRSGYIGYSAAGTDHISIANQQGNGGIILSTAGTGIVSTNGRFQATKIGSFAGNAAIEMNSTAPFLEWRESDGALDNKRWGMYVAGEQFVAAVADDAGSASLNWLTVDRTAVSSIDLITLSSNTINLVAGALTHNGVAIQNTTTADDAATRNSPPRMFSPAGLRRSCRPCRRLRWNESDAGADEKTGR